jgi:hypothetical protein
MNLRRFSNGLVSFPWHAGVFASSVTYVIGPFCCSMGALVSEFAFAATW